MTSAGNMATLARFLGSGMKCDASEPDCPKLGNAFFN